MKDIPIAHAKELAEKNGLDQVIIIGRKVGSHESVTTYGVDKSNCSAAAKIGVFLKRKIMGWPEVDC